MPDRATSAASSYPHTPHLQFSMRMARPPFPSNAGPMYTDLTEGTAREAGGSERTHTARRLAMGHGTVRHD